MEKNSNVLYREEFPRSNAYDLSWIMEHQMGPNPLWLVEWLSQKMDLQPGMRVLDLGCGTALTSIFLAREFAVDVWAADLWVHQDDNWTRIREAGQGRRVYPMRAEAHSLPFAEAFFDAVISIDAYQYFGTDELYLSYVSRFLRPEGRIGVVIPGLMRPMEDGVPQHLCRKQSNGAVFWEESCNCFLTSDRWRALWSRCGSVRLETVDELAEGWRHWRDFEIELERSGKNRFPSPAETLDEDRGRYVGFIRLTARKQAESELLNLYDPDIISRLNKPTTPS